MKYTIWQLDNTRMSVKQFLEEEDVIPYWKISAGYHYITISELKEKYYDKEILFVLYRKSDGFDEKGEIIINTLNAEVQL